MVVPTDLRDVGIPDFTVHLIDRASPLFAPRENFLVATACESALAERIVVEVEKLDQPEVKAFAEIVVKFFPETTGRMETDFPEKTRQILETAEFIEGAAWEERRIGSRHLGG